MPENVVTLGNKRGMCRSKKTEFVSHLQFLRQTSKGIPSVCHHLLCRSGCLGGLSRQCWRRCSDTLQTQRPLQQSGPPRSVWSTNIHISKSGKNTQVWKAHYLCHQWQESCFPCRANNGGCGARPPAHFQLISQVKTWQKHTVSINACMLEQFLKRRMVDSVVGSCLEGFKCILWGKKKISMIFSAEHTFFLPWSTSCLWATLRMWLCADEAGKLSDTGLHREEEDGHTHLQEEHKEESHSAVLTQDIIWYFQVCVCFSQLRSAGGRSEHWEMPWSSLLDLNHLYQQYNVLFPCPDRDKASVCELMLYCWSMKDAEVVLSSCPLASRHSWGVIPHF